MVEKLKRTVVTSRHSWSKSIIETVNGSHNFTIDGYGLAKGSGPGKYVSSNVFNVDGYDWAVYFYPDGKNPEDSATYVSVFIALASEGTNVRALFELTLMDQSGKGKHKVHSHFDRALESGPYTLKYRGSMWGYKRFFRRVNLESSDYLKNDSLQMHCTVGVVRNRVDGPKLYDIQIPPSNIGTDFKYLLDSGCVQADITFLVGDEKLKAHKLVLAAHSHVFKAQFFGNIGNIGNHNLDEVEVVGIEAAVFKLMLQCIYSSDLPNTSELVYSTSVSTSTIMLQHLLAAADRYDLDRLKLLCEAKLAEEINIDTVAMTLSLAEQHRCLQLKALCLKFAATNMGAVTQTEGFRNLKGSCPRLVSELLETYASTDQNSNAISSSKKRSRRINSNNSSSSVLGLNLGVEEASRTANIATFRRVQRRL